MSSLLLGTPHHDGSAQYVSTQNPALGDDVDVRVCVPHGPDGARGVDRVLLRAVRDAEPVVTEAQVDR